MHETHLIENILAYLESEEQSSCREIKKIHISLSEFGAISKEHFLGHFREAANGTKWETLDMEFTTVPYGAEMSITKIDYAKQLRGGEA